VVVRHSRRVGRVSLRISEGRIRRDLGSDVVANARHYAVAITKQGAELLVERLKDVAEAS
jgi:hypothetical protein